MARKDTTNQAGATAPAKDIAGDDVKVDIETEDTQEVEAAPAEPVEADVIDGDTVEAAAEAVEADEVELDDEQARIEAAIAAGEAAAAEDFKADATKLAAERDELASQIDAAKAEAAEAKESFMRLRADWENYRKRAERERITERERACETLIKDLLPGIDDLERAIEHASTAAEGDEVAKQLVDGVSAVHTKLVAALEKQGAEVIDPAGEAFDPQEHQAVGRIENADVYDETVQDVYQKGYRLAGKVVRPAMVTVAYGGAKRPTEPEVEAQDGAEGAE